MNVACVKKIIPSKLHRLIIVLCFLLLSVFTGREGRAGEIIDMAGRSVSIGRVDRVWSAYPPVTYLMYALDPSLLIGWTGYLSEESKKYISSPYRNMPVVGGWFGQRTPSLESLASARPDVALVWDQSLIAMPAMAEKLSALHIPTVAIRLFRLSDYPETLNFLGDVLDRKKRAKALAAYIEQAIEEMTVFSGGIDNMKKVSVYYAAGADGLKNDCDHSPFLDEAINLAGGRNIHRCHEPDSVIGQKIDMELLLLYDPDVIITQDDIFFNNVYTGTRYSSLRAVKARKVYRIPKTPFNWLNYPPSFMRAIGIRWLAATLYPELYTKDLKKETKHFFRLFLNMDITDREAEKILFQP